MKKILILIAIATFVLISCDDDKNDKKDTDVLPDNDTDIIVPDEDIVTPDEDEIVPDEDTVTPDEDEIVPDEDIVTPDEDEIVPDEDTVEPVCNSGEGQIIVCETDSAKKQKQFCDTEGQWQNDGGCYTSKGLPPCTDITAYYTDAAELTAAPKPGESCYGQDAQYALRGYCTPKSFTVSGTAPEEIITDNNTGVQWIKTLNDYDASGLSLEESETYCGGLTYGEFSDWRVPTMYELEAVVNFEKSDPPFTAGFTGLPEGESLWSTTPNGQAADSVWIMDSSDGNTGIDDITSYNFTMCVRGEAYNPTHTFTETDVNGDIIVEDSATDLKWTKTSVENKKWTEAIAYCEDLTYAAYSDWRLPNINELKTIVDRTRTEPPASSFPEITSNFYWSSSTNYVYPYNAWIVSMAHGNSNSADKTYAGEEGSYYKVLCVRN